MVCVYTSNNMAASEPENAIHLQTVNNEIISNKQNDLDNTEEIKFQKKKQRKVSDKLGKNNSHNHEKIYKEIEKRIGKTKKCRFGHKGGSITGIKHEGEEDVPITEWELKGVSVNGNGEVKITSGDGLQGFCRNCSIRRRKKRIEMSREKNEQGDGYDTYEKEYGRNTKKCSACQETKNVRENFKLSPGMECGIHNLCNNCSKMYGDSMGDRVIKYRPDGNFKYQKTAENQHDDHIMPLKYGGTNEEVNHQLLPSNVNLSKSSTIPYNTIHEIPLEQMCERWRPILEKAKNEDISIKLFESRIAHSILEENKKIFCMTDSEIERVYKSYNRQNNKRINTKRAVEKFKIYCKEILKL